MLRASTLLQHRIFGGRFEFFCRSSKHRPTKAEQTQPFSQCFARSGKFTGHTLALPIKACLRWRDHVLTNRSLQPIFQPHRMNSTFTTSNIAWVRLSTIVVLGKTHALFLTAVKSAWFQFWPVLGIKTQPLFWSWTIPITLNYTAMKCISVDVIILFSGVILVVKRIWEWK